jgi:hypothetical protein
MTFDSTEFVLGYALGGAFSAAILWWFWGPDDDD